MRLRNPVYWLLERITRTRALDECRGPYELAFFEPMHRMFYFAGLSSVDRGRGYRLYHQLVLLSVAVFVSSELWCLFTETSSLDTLIDNSNVTIIHLISIYRYKSMVDHSNLYDRLSLAMQTELFDVDTEERKQLLEFWIQKNTKYVKLLFGLGACCLSIWYVYPLIDNVEYNLPVAMKLPFDYQTPELYRISYPCVLLVFHFISYFVVMNDIFMQSHLLYVICQFSVLSNCFENILEDSGCEALRKQKEVNQKEYKIKYIERLSKLVKQHKLIIKNTLELRNVLSMPMLCQFLASSLLICFSGYQITATLKLNKSKFLMSLLYLLYNLFQFFLYCRWCDEIKIQSASIGQAIYSSGWECGGVAAWPGVRARLLLVMLRASKPLVITAGGLYELSLESYSTLVKTSYSALTVLLRVRDD